MSNEKLSNAPTTRYKSLHDLNLEGFLWVERGSEWSSIIREECLSTINQPIEEEISNLTNKVVLSGILAVLALLGAATWTRIPEISKAVQEAGRNSVEQLILGDYYSAIK